MAQVLSQPSYGSSPRVVIVDDHPTFRHAARMLLAARGYDVVGEASCAASALDAVERHAPRAVLLDVCLGDDDGIELCGLLTRSHPELEVLLASAEEHDPELITRCGATGFVQKHRFLQTDFAQFWHSDVTWPQEPTPEPSLSAAISGKPHAAPRPRSYPEPSSVITSWTICHFCKHFKPCERWYNRWRCSDCLQPDE